MLSNDCMFATGRLGYREQPASAYLPGIAWRWLLVERFALALPARYVLDQHALRQATPCISYGSTS